MKKKLLLPIIILILTGCASIKVKESSVEHRTVSVVLPFGIKFEKEIKGLVIGEAERNKEKEDDDDDSGIPE